MKIMQSIHFLFLIISWTNGTALSVPFTSNDELKQAVNLYLSDASIQANKDELIGKYGELPEWDVSRITSMKNIFGYLSDKLISGDTSDIIERGECCDLSKWNVDKVTDFSDMFQFNKWFNSDLSKCKWSTSKVTDFTSTFNNAKLFTSDLSKWDVSNVDDMTKTFRGAAKFNSDLSKWSTSKVTDLASTFMYTKLFTSDLSKWDVSKVEDMTATFEDAAEFNSDLSKWSIKATKMDKFLTSSSVMFKQGTFCTEAWYKAPFKDWDSVDGSDVFCCEPGNYLSNITTKKCQSCPQGRFSNAFGLHQKCKKCARDSIAPSTGSVDCGPCTVRNEFSSINRKVCLRCGAGKFTQIGINESVCSNCPLGQYKEDTFAKACSNCPTGWHQSELGRPFCFPCEPGTTQNQESQENCNSCEIGRYIATSKSTAASCNQCVKGQYQRQTGQSACLNCLAGTYNEVQGSSHPSACSDCQAGYYSSAIGVTKAENCIKCAPGKWSDTIGATLISDCQDCAVGYFSSDEGRVSICEKCPDDATTEEKGKTLCSKCDAGFHMETATGSKTCRVCPSGFVSVYGVAQCDKCQAGTYQDQPGQSACLNCLAGTYNEVLGSSNPSACCVCQAGYYSSAVGATSKSNCIDCPAGRFGTISGSSNIDNACQNCPTGFIQVSSGQSNCSAVKIGTIVLQGTAQVDVPLGSFIKPDGTGFDQCKAGTKGNNQDKASCEKCPMGTTSFEGSISCFPCAKGKFGATPGLSKCTDCLEHTYQEQERVASSTCINCPTGYDQKKTGSMSCDDLGAKKPEDCTEVQYLNDTDADQFQWTCISCPIGGECGASTTNSTTIRRKFGYWRIPFDQRISKNEMFALCKYPPACPGLPNNDFRETYPDSAMSSNDSFPCSKILGHTKSRLCQKCLPSYGRIGTSQCTKCSQNEKDTAAMKGLATLFVSLSIVVAVFFYTVMVFCKMRSISTFFRKRTESHLKHTTAHQADLKFERKSHSTLKRILLSHLQFVSIIMSLNVPWPKLLTEILSTVTSVASFSSDRQQSQWECLWQALWWFCLAKIHKIFRCGSKEMNFKGKLCTFVPKEKANTYNAKYIPSSADAWIMCSILLHFLVLPSLLRLSFQVISCTNVVPESSMSYITIDLELSCWSPNHITTVLGIALPTVLFYGFVVPGLIILRLSKVGQLRETDPSLLFRYGMFHNGYRTEKYWWEAVVIFRKILLISVATFIQVDALQLHVCLGIIAVSLHLHDTNRPMGTDPEHSHLHSYETWSLLIQLLLVWSAVLFVFGYCSTAFICDGLVLLLVGANGIYVSVLSVTCLKEYKKNNLTTIKKICKCCYKKNKKKRSTQSTEIEMGERTGGEVAEIDEVFEWGENKNEMYLNPMKMKKKEVEVEGMQMNPMRKARLSAYETREI